MGRPCMSKKIINLNIFSQFQKELQTLSDSSFFITGTDTDIGKTFISVIISHFLHLKYNQVSYIKPVGAGESQTQSDELFLKEFGPKDILLKTFYSLLLPASPHLAAKNESVKIDPISLVQNIKKILTTQPSGLVEGAGGLMVPLTHEYLIIDLIQDLQLPTIVIGQAGLGTINHTLLSVNALRQKGIKVPLIILNNCNKSVVDTIILDNVKTIQNLTGIKTILFPYIPSIENFKNDITI